MPGNDHISWPPAPEAVQPERVGRPVNSVVGWISLILAIPQLAFYLLLVVSQVALTKWGYVVGAGWGFDPSRREVVFLWLSLMLSLLLSVVFGVVGYRSKAGKIGLTMTGISVACLVWLMSTTALYI